MSGVGARIAQLPGRPAVHGLARTLGTTLILQHNGLPRTPFYAERHLRGLLENAGVPRRLAGYVDGFLAHPDTV